MTKQSSFDSDKLLDVLDGSSVLNRQELVYALVEIEESFEKVYSDILPQILAEESIDKDRLRDLLWDIREEFRHIEYHIQDSQVTEL